MRIISLLNQKGGVGKTTTAVNLGAALALQGHRVVVVDLDPQANLTVHLGLELPADAPSTYRLLLGEVPFGESALETGTPGLRVIATDLDLSGAELELSNQFGRETLLRDSIRTWAEKHRAEHGEDPVDFVLLDCPPSLGLLSVNSLTASDEVFICVQTEFFALRGLSKLMDVVTLVKSRLHPALEITGIIACLYDNRLKLAREVLGELKRYFGELVFPRPIGVNVKLAEAPSYGQTIFEYAPDSTGARDYRQLAEDVLARGRSDSEPELREETLTPQAPATDSVAEPVQANAPTDEAVAPDSGTG